jgi:hypothetical protein
MSTAPLNTRDATDRGQQADLRLLTRFAFAGQPGPAYEPGDRDRGGAGYRGDGRAWRRACLASCSCWTEHKTRSSAGVGAPSDGGLIARPTTSRPESLMDALHAGTQPPPWWHHADIQRPMPPIRMTMLNWRSRRLFSRTQSRALVYELATPSFRQMSMPKPVCPKHGDRHSPRPAGA